MTETALPSFTDSVDQRYFIEPLNASKHLASYLDRFPESLYNKSPDSHFIRFMYALLGPVGVGWLRDQYTEARLQLEEAGVRGFKLDAFYGDPFSFGRILDENFADDITGLLTSASWAIVRAQDERYRSRAIQYMNAARMGTTPLGMALAASSGIGQDVEVIENYKSLFDAHADDPLGLPHLGRSRDLGEWIIRPKPAISRTQQQVIQFSKSSIPLGTNTYNLTFNGSSTPDLTSASLAPDLQAALEALKTIGPNNVRVKGGPYPHDFVVTFYGQLSNQVLPALVAQFLDGSTNLLIDIPVEIHIGAVDPNTQAVIIPDVDMHSMQVAIDHLRPVATYPTITLGRSDLHPQDWAGIVASSEFISVERFVTGSPNILWPPTDINHWIVSSEEIEAPRLQDGGPQHYVCFHDVAAVYPYTDLALADPAYNTNLAVLANYNSVHVGPFPEMRNVIPFYRQFDQDYTDVFAGGRVLATTPNPLTVTAQTDDGTAFINDGYPADYLSLPGIPLRTSYDNNFWASQDRPSGAEILEIDLGSPQAVNFLAFEVAHKPIAVTVAYDLLDQYPARNFAPVVYKTVVPTDTTVHYDPTQGNPWQHIQLYFDDGLTTIFTRFIRLTFTRQATDNTFGGFLFDPIKGTQAPWTIDVRNLRLGRNVAPSAAVEGFDDSGIPMEFGSP